MAQSTKDEHFVNMPEDINPEWTQEDFAKARLALEVLPEIFTKAVVDTLINQDGSIKG